MLDARLKTPRPDGLAGEWMSLEELGQLEPFRSDKRAFKIKLNTNFAVTAGQREPGVKAAVKQEYQKDEIICKAGEYGSTAFLLLEGRARAEVPQSGAPPMVSGRTGRSLTRLKAMFSRRTVGARTASVDEVEIGEISPFASIACERPPRPVIYEAGDLFGIDACINHYPREATVLAEERCVVLEMLQSVLDSIRDAGSAGGRIEAGYRDVAVRNQLYLSPLFGDLPATQLDRLAANASLLTPDSDEIKSGVIYTEGEAADATYLIRSGTIKLSRQQPKGEFVFAYLGRGAAFGFESILPSLPTHHLLLECTSHPAEFPPVEIKGALTLGRSAGCEVRLPRENRAIGRRHCQIEERAGEVYLTDLNSANFTLLNGERVIEALLTAGDRITIVDYTFTLRRASVEAAEPTPLPRLATAIGLDNFEIIKIGGAELRRLATEDEGFAANAASFARSMEATAPGGALADSALVEDLVDAELYNSQNVLLIDLDRCTRCDECVRACADAHGGVTRFTRDGPRFGKYLVTMACRSCSDPKCMIGCPVGSIRREGSLEIRIEDWCIGCQRCANQCPFGNINMLDLTDTIPSADPVSPAVASPDDVRLRATVCDLCAGYDGPSCVYACPHDAAIRVNPATFLSGADRR